MQEAQGAGDSGLPELAPRERRRGRLPLRARGGGDAARSPSIGSWRCSARRCSSTRRTGAPRCSSSACSATTGRWDDLAAGARAVRRARRRRRTRRSPAGCGSRATSRRSSKSADRAAAAYERVLDLSPGQRRGDELPRRPLHRRARCGTTSSRSTRASSRRARSAARTRSPARRCRSRWSTGACAGSPRRPSRGSSGCASSSPRTRGCSSSSASGARRAARTRAWRTILTDAQRAMPDGPERGALVAEIAKLAEDGANAQKAIEQWRARPAAGPAQQGRARRAEAPLPRRRRAGTRSRTCCGRSSTSSRRTTRPGRLPVLREIAAVYREHVKSDSALVTVLTQIVQLDPTDLRERARARARLRGAAALARPADDAGAPGRARARARREGRALARHRAALARAVLERAERRRGLREAPRGRSARPRGGRPAEGALRQAARLQAALRSARAGGRRDAAPGPAAARAVDGDGEARRRAPRPGRRRRWRSTSACSTRSPSSAGALDALEKQAERDKDFATVAEVLERRAALAPDDADAPRRPPEARRHLLRAAPRSRQGR